MIQRLGHGHALRGVFVQQPQDEIDCWVISANVGKSKKKKKTALTLPANVSLLQQGYIRWLSKAGSNPLLNDKWLASERTRTQGQIDTYLYRKSAILIKG